VGQHIDHRSEVLRCARRRTRKIEDECGAERARLAAGEAPEGSGRTHRFRQPGASRSTTLLVASGVRSRSASPVPPWWRSPRRTLRQAHEGRAEWLEAIGDGDVLGHRESRFGEYGGHRGSGAVLPGARCDRVGHGHHLGRKLHGGSLLSALDAAGTHFVSNFRGICGRIRDSCGMRPVVSASWRPTGSARLRPARCQRRHGAPLGGPGPARGGGIPEGKRVIEGPILAAFARTFAEEPGPSRPRRNRFVGIVTAVTRTPSCQGRHRGGTPPPGVADEQGSGR